MGVISTKINDDTVKNAPPSIHRISDIEIQGFHVRLGKWKANRQREGDYYLHCSSDIVNGAERNIKISPIDAISADEARSLAKSLISQLTKNSVDKNNHSNGQIEPNFIQDKPAEDNDPIVYITQANQLIKRYIDHLSGIKSKDASDTIRTLIIDIIPKLKGVSIAELNASFLLERCIDPIVTRDCKQHAGVVFLVLKQMLDFSVNEGVLSFNPLNRIRREDITGITSPDKRYLNAQELDTVFSTLKKLKVTPQVTTALEILLLTGLRLNQLCASKWQHVNQKSGIWIFPNQTISFLNVNSDDHYVCLNEAIIQRLNTLKALAQNIDSPFILPSLTTKKSDPRSISIDKRSVTRSIARNLDNFGIDKFTPNDFRETMKVHLIGMGVNAILIEQMLDRKLPVNLRGYCGIADKQARLDAQNLWADYLTKVIGAWQ
ncbi:tyrosine-type recombinase/integrase [Flocculibacter collagenilyticus]|uniref:tyrosine-type recombinase/integrase n=1 Tax=Flocculibacter collagenilyticus TaxID=2744479 RepID=UPI0018F5CFE6|nr:tyrosine-type recombinase/integrase [Flocculibacter collagenilyticus]